MNRLFLLFTICILSLNANTQNSIKLDYLTTVPQAIKNCGGLYTYDSISLDNKIYIFVADYQDKGLIRVAGKDVSLLLASTTPSEENSVSIYKGAGYTVTVTIKSGVPGAIDKTETGTLIITKNSKKSVFNIHGETGCDDSTQEGNSR